MLYWMRMKDLRLRDNKALSLASEAAQKHGKSLVILHVLSPGDYQAHDRAPIRIDFVLRNLALLQVSASLPTAGHIGGAMRTTAGGITIQPFPLLL